MIDATHPDADVLFKIRDAILARCGGSESLRTALPILIGSAIEFVIDPVRTARTAVTELDNVEKTFIGLKVEHFFRDFIDLPKGLRDLEIDGIDLDIKNTVGATWMIPPETYRQEEACLLIASASVENTCSLGIMIARDQYLTKPNRDQKRGVNKAGRANILWLVRSESLPPSRWEGLDMLRFRELRRVNGGTKRAAIFFRENLNKRMNRSVIKALLFDQQDYMKRLRENGGARDILAPEGIVLLSGAYDSDKIHALGIAPLQPDEFIAVRVNG